MGKQRNKSSPFSPHDISILLRAKKENKIVAFEKGRPVIKDVPTEFHRRRGDTQPGGEICAMKPGSILSPVEDVLMMSGILELLASHYSEGLSEIERRREDCTHLLEPEHDENGEALDGVTDETVLAVGRKLERIGVERRNIKNRFEMVKTVKRAFASQPGQEALLFLRGLLAEAAGVLAEQRSRTYTPRTDELDDIPDAFQHKTLAAMREEVAV